MSSARRVFRPTLCFSNSLSTVLYGRGPYFKHPRALETDAKDKSAEIGSPGFKPLDARAVGEPETVRIGRTTFKQLLGSIQGDLGKSGSTSLRVSNFERRGM